MSKNNLIEAYAHYIALQQKDLSMSSTNTVDLNEVDLMRNPRFIPDPKPIPNPKTVNNNPFKPSDRKPSGITPITAEPGFSIEEHPNALRNKGGFTHQVIGPDGKVHSEHPSLSAAQQAVPKQKIDKQPHKPW